MDNAELSRCERVAIELAEIAGRKMQTASRGRLNVETKISPRDLVTEVDKDVEQYLFGQLKKHFPGHEFIGEEGSGDSKVKLTSAPTWIIDPVDGTLNFVHSYPMVCVSIGLVVNHEAVLGVIYAPFIDVLYTAKKGTIYYSKLFASLYILSEILNALNLHSLLSGHGAFRNGHPIRVSQNCRSLSEALVSTCVGSSNPDDSYRSKTFDNVKAVGMKCQDMRGIGSGALGLCQLADGGVDGYFQFGHHCWDVAAAAIIITEAGGIVLNFDGGPFDLMSRKIVAASSVELAHELRKTVPHILDDKRDDE